MKSLEKRVKEELVRSSRGLTVRELYDTLQPKKAFSIEKTLIALERTNEVVLSGFRENGAAIYRANNFCSTFNIRRSGETGIHVALKML